MKKKILAEEYLSKANLITLSVFVVSSLIIAYFFFRQAEFINVQLLITNENILYTDRMPPFWYEESIKEGAEEKDNFGRTIAKINKIKSFEAEKNYRDIYLDISLKVLTDKRGNSQTFRGKPIKVGSYIALNPGNTIIEGIITDIEGKDELEEDITVKTRLSNWTFPDFKISYQSAEKNFSGIDPLYVDKINIGDSVKDVNGNTIAEVIEKSSLPGKRLETDSQGNPRLVQDPFFKDVFLTLKLKTIKASMSHYYMYRYKVKIGEIIPLYFDKITLPVEIIELSSQSR